MRIFFMNDASRRRGAARRLVVSLVALLLGCSGVNPQFASPSPTPVPLPDVVTTSDIAAERLDQVQTEVAANQTGSNVSRELAAMTKEIDARIDETKRMLAPGVPLETLRDLGALPEVDRAACALDARTDRSRNGARPPDRADAGAADNLEVDARTRRRNCRSALRAC